ncbi:hypothetical protein AgCh_023975 [Apium graveolens]
MWNLGQSLHILWWKPLDFAALKRSLVSYFDDEKQETAISRWDRAKTRAFKVGKGLSKSEKAQNTSRNLCVGKKKKGEFQHFSFLSGGATIVAGILLAYGGVFEAIWPYSGQCGSQQCGSHQYKETIKMDEVKKFYPLSGFEANVALVPSLVVCYSG